MNQKIVEQLIRGTNGRLFTVTFTKKDGTERTMTARTGVKQGLTGKGMSYDPKARGLIPVFEFRGKQRRMVNTETTTAFKCGKQVWRAA